LLHPKKVGTIPVGENAEEVKQTNEIKVAAPLLDSIDIENKDITADALHTQWKFARYLVEQRKAHYHFTVKSNQPTLLNDISYYFQNSDKEPEFVDVTNGEHGRIETRKIWTTTELNGYLSFPCIGQAFAIEGEFVNKRTGKFRTTDLYMRFQYVMENLAKFQMQQIEHRTSNAQRRIWKALRFTFIIMAGYIIRRSMFNVRCWTFIFFCP
jgi:predicted transposase YbfD/YdcC